MDKRMNSLVNIQSLGILILMIQLNPNIILCEGGEIIPASKAALGDWFLENVKPFKSRTGTLDPALEAAEANPKIIRVRKDGSGDFKTITDALKSVPVKNKRRIIVNIGPGIYNEKISVDIDKPFITFYGSPTNMPTITYDDTAKKYGTDDSATVIINSDYFVARYIIFKNHAPRPNGAAQAQALAMRIWGNKAALYNCRLIGFQDTLCDDQGFHFYKDCYIEGTYDFIFGHGKSMFLNTELFVIDDRFLTVIAAQAREKTADDTGFAFVHCRVTGKGKGAVLGRAWMAMPRVTFLYTEMGPNVSPAGWFNNNHPEREKTVAFAEYKSIGPGSQPGQRVKYSKQLTDEEAKEYLSLSYIEGSKWLLPPPSLPKN